MIRVVIVEDDKNEIERLKNYLDRYGKESGENFTFDIYTDGLEFLEKCRQPFDAVFMDIEMPHMNGMEAAHRMREFDAEVPLVFITNLKQYALKGYAVSAMDFLVKPVSYAAFSTMMGRVCTRLKKRADDELYIHNTRGSYRIKVSDIYYVEVIKHYIIFHTAHGDIQIWGCLTDIEKRLPEGSFARCNNCYLANLAYVDRVDGNDLYIGKSVLAVSRGKKPEFMKKLLEYMER